MSFSDRTGKVIKKENPPQTEGGHLSITIASKLLKLEMNAEL
jgi:hypothetical protein